MDISPKDFCSKFAPICQKEKEADILLNAMQQRNCSKGDILLEPGQTNDTLYLVWSGSLTVSLHQENVTIELGSILPGGWTGELGFIEPGPVTATVMAEEDTSLLCLDQDGLQELLDKDPDIVIQLLHTFSLSLAERLRATKQHVFKQIAEDNFRLSKGAPSDKPGRWYKYLGRKLMGISGERS